MKTRTYLETNSRACRLWGVYVDGTSGLLGLVLVACAASVMPRSFNLPCNRRE